MLKFVPYTEAERRLISETAAAAEAEGRPVMSALRAILPQFDTPRNVRSLYQRWVYQRLVAEGHKKPGRKPPATYLERYPIRMKPVPVVESDFIQPPSRARLMAGR